MNDRFLTVSEAAKLLGISASTLRRMEQDGVVKGYGLKVIYTPGGQRRYMMNEVQYVYAQQGFSGRLGSGTRPAVLVRDLTQAFTDPNSKLSIELKGQIEAVAQLVRTANEMRVPVVFTKTIYDPECRFSQLWGRKFPYLQVLEPGGAWGEIHEELSRLRYDLVHETAYVNDFHHSPVEELLRREGTDTVILAGATTSGSIRATAVEAFQKEFHVMIPEEAVGDRSDAIQNFTLLDLNARYADVVSMSETLTYLKSCSDRPADTEE
ncbi:isochorismatase family protein [Paenibacillaceae bacterium WGS1546]|uniref:isochorismatase family protein n=1 Tax=Cohnella sp. WGS1546 TaxID=3366810 RepID=UPI00372D1118